MPRQIASTRPRGLRLTTAMVLSAAALVGCNDDGRTLRPARPDQDASVSTTTPPTEPAPAVEEVDGGLEAFTTLAGSPTTGATTTVALAPFAPVLSGPWTDGDPLDPRYTCDGENVSPALSWTAAPEGTVEIAIAVTDGDADFVHWTVAALDPLSTALGEGRVPEFAVQGLNSSGTLGYTGPCPPQGEVHTYHFTVFFLGQQTELFDGSAGVDLLTQMRASAFDSASLSATYGRP